eukprot:CAMPEP_0179122254 /NCGR_PEP_ID=MMETSP0796-20121207/57694_1 /TAXON_ID=73915 /ORGANISM="Pyrodinium bahamense, Strain pbaha01" /LENGTH=210 /DNA_ID=CAMNT_0020820877 /DNA_START=137 /DNA_END=767 /DNA_ORIENTATION=-
MWQKVQVLPLEQLLSFQNHAHGLHFPLLCPAAPTDQAGARSSGAAKLFWASRSTGMPAPSSAPLAASAPAESSDSSSVSGDSGPAASERGLLLAEGPGDKRNRMMGTGGGALACSNAWARKNGSQGFESPESDPRGLRSKEPQTMCRSSAGDDGSSQTLLCSPMDLAVLVTAWLDLSVARQQRGSAPRCPAMATSLELRALNRWRGLGLE